MAYENRDNEGALFPNQKKTTDKHPAYRGEAIIDGKPYWMSEWENTSRNGNPYRKVTFEPKDDTDQRPRDAGGAESEDIVF